MAQRMHGGWFGDTGFLFRGVEHSLDTGFAVPPSGLAFEQVLFRPVLAEVVIQHVKQLGAEQGNTVLLAFTSPNEDLAAVAVDIRKVQPQSFAHAQPGGVDEHEHAAVLQVRRGLQQGSHFLFAEHCGQFLLLARPFDERDTPTPTPGQR